MTSIDHAYAEEHGLVDAYLKDRLSETERDAFEAHFFGCETCIAQLELANDFREGMRDVAATETARTQLGFLATLAALSWAQRAVLAAALLLLIALPGFLLARNRGLERQLAEARTAAPPPSGTDPKVADLEARLKSLQASGAADRQRLEAELAQARQAPPSDNRPQVNIPIFVLAALRSADEAGREPVNQIPLPTAGQPLLLTIELATVDSPTYQASLLDGKGKEIWQSTGLKADDRDTLNLLLPSSMLAPGLYELRIEGGKGVTVGAYPFRVVGRP